MSLRSQIAIILACLSLLQAGATWAVHFFVTMPAFLGIEREFAQRNMGQCLDAIEGELANLSKLANDWGAWDDPYQFVVDRNEEFRRKNLMEETFVNTSTNLLCFLNNDREIVWSDCRDIQTLEQVKVDDVYELIRRENGPLTSHRHADDSRQGLIVTARGPMLIVSRPIIPTRREGSIRGSVVMGRFLSAEQTRILARRLHMDLSITETGRTGVPESLPVSQLLLNKSVLLENVSASLMTASAVLPDMFGHAAILVQLTLPRKITALGSSAAWASKICGLFCTILTMLGIAACLHFRILQPLQALSAHAARIGHNDDLKARLNLRRRDEIGSLADRFDQMVENLAVSRSKLLEAVHRAGMAESVSELLHNVGNAVNSAGCSTELLEERLSSSRISGLGRATAMLQEQKPQAADFFSADARGMQLIDYLIGLNEKLQEEHVSNLNEVTRLHETIRHIRSAIAERRTFAAGAEFRQETELKSLLKEVIRLSEPELNTVAVQVRLIVPPLPHLNLNTTRMTQILMNLVKNAVQAMNSTPVGQRVLTIAARFLPPHGIEIDVADTGCGISPEVHEKLFRHGFTTRSDGHGLGLHYCANAIREAGGDISVFSGGLHGETTFRIQLPNVFPESIAVGDYEDDTAQPSAGFRIREHPALCS